MLFRTIWLLPLIFNIMCGVSSISVNFFDQLYVMHMYPLSMCMLLKTVGIKMAREENPSFLSVDCDSP